MDTPHVVEWLKLNRTYRLTVALTAFAISPSKQNADRYGPVCELPEGADLEICGAGFSERTVKARYGDCYYHVYWRDLASATLCDVAVPLEDLVFTA
jgi:hypothetical protein